VSFVLVLASVALGGWGQGGGCPGGFCPDPGPGSMLQRPFFLPPPQVIQQPVVQQFGPPISDGKANGKLCMVEIEHANGQRWRYTFATPIDATVNLDTANSNAALSVEFPAERKGRFPSPPKKLKECKNKDCCCEDCKCDPCHCGEKSPVVQAQEDATLPNYGLDIERIKSNSKDFDYSINGKRCSKRQAMDAIAGDGIVDDSTHLRLSVIGTEAECKPIVDDVAGDKFKGLNFTFQSYRPDDVMVKEIGLHPGKPAVYLQQPDGKVLARWESYAGPEQTAGAIRKADPNYDPLKDPNPDKPAPVLPSLPNIDLSKLPGWIWGIVAFIAMSIFKQPVKV
jgi:hypothetical protein